MYQTQGKLLRNDKKKIYCKKKMLKLIRLLGKKEKDGRLIWMKKKNEKDKNEKKKIGWKLDKNWKKQHKNGKKRR